MAAFLGAPLGLVQAQPADPTPEPTPTLEPTPESAPEPTPFLAPDPKPTPTRAPVPTSNPEPTPTQAPEPTPTQAPEPTSTPPPAAEKSSAVPSSSSAEPHTPNAASRWGTFYLGLDVGIGIPAGGSALFEPGPGLAYRLGVRSRSWSLDASLGATYNLATAEIAGGSLDGELSTSTVTLRKIIPMGDSLHLTAGGGPAYVKSSLVATSALDNSLVVLPRAGIGLGAAAGVASHLGSGLEVYADLHAFFVRWEHPAAPVIHDQTEMDGIIRGIDPKDGVPFQVSVGARYAWGSKGGDDD